MNTYTYRIVSILFAMLLVFSCSQDSTDDSISLEASVDVTYSNLETEVLTMINDHRNSINLNPLQVSDMVSAVAQIHTEYMITTSEVSHDFFLRRVSLLKNNPGALTTSENVAFGFATSGGVVRGWLNSDEHRAIIETSSFTHFGISIDRDDEGRNYFTHIFIEL